MLDTLSYSDSLQRDQHSDRMLAESFTFTEDINAARQGWFTRNLREVLALAENFTYDGVGLESGVSDSIRKLIRSSKEFCMAAFQRIRGYGQDAPTETDRLDRSGDDFSKRYQ